MSMLDQDISDSYLYNVKMMRSMMHADITQAYQQNDSNRAYIEQAC